MKQYIKINENDNVYVALKDLKKGTIIEKIELIEDISLGFKIASNDIKKDEPIIKYGNLIGYASKDIKQGEHVHVDNIYTSLSNILDYEYNPVNFLEKKFREDYFYGFERKDGKVGIRNQIWIIPTVGCVNNIVRKIEEESKKFIVDSVDNIVSFNHPYGCSQMGQDQENTRIILANLIKHPNAGGVLVVGLGCENSNIEELKKYLNNYDDTRVKFMVCQECEDEVKEGVGLVKELVEIVKNDTRSKVSTTKLIVGLKCGGSDGLSGITANPIVGSFTDILIETGGSIILTEVPEMFGAEHILMNRCKNKEVFSKTVKLINDFKKYYEDNHQTIYENPSPGNKAGGISTLEDKSLGCIQKSGKSIVNDVLCYGEVVKEKGLSLLSAPGNDIVSSTALAAIGCQIILFTTGRGTPLSSIVPTVKISSNTSLYERKKNWIDFNAGELVDNENIQIQEMGEKLYNLVIEIANGKKVKAEVAGYIDLAIFKNGVTL